MTHPRHVSPRPDRAASAPYNFVPLPQAVLPAVGCVPGEPWCRHDRYDPMPRPPAFDSGLLSGSIELTITTETPLFIRGVQKPDPDGGWQAGRDANARLRPDPAMTPDGRPLIPGSSLRGMLRTLVEILAFAKVQPVAGTRPFFRDFSGSGQRLHNAYANRIRPGGHPPQAGFLHHTADGWIIKPTTVWRVSHDVIGPAAVAVAHNNGERFSYGRPPGYRPNWRFQQRPCWARHDSADGVTELNFAVELPQGAVEDDWQPGTLVLTGAAPPPRVEDGHPVGGEKAEYFFLPPLPDVAARTVTDAQIDRFHDADQVSEWQQGAFPVNQPVANSRRVKGYVRSGEPVFFVPNDESGVTFFGRARYFRMPYDQALSELVPAAVSASAADLDLAEALFGRVGRDACEATAVRGRVRVEDSVACDPPPDAVMEEIVPKTLLSPKPTTYAHYLTQDGRLAATGRTTYLQGDRTAVRGHKLYWHRWPEDAAAGLALVTETPQAAWRAAVRDGSDKLHTLIRPLRAGVAFQGRVRFDNLSPVELGALLSAVRLPAGCRHKLGMGRALGLGSVRLEADLHLVDRAARYSSWNASGERAGPDAAAVEHNCQQAFTSTVLKHALASGEAMTKAGTGLAAVSRLEALFLLLGWQNRPPPERTQPMELAQFRAKKVLPGPHQVSGLAEPPWPGPDPSAATIERLPADNGPSQPYSGDDAGVAVTPETVTPRDGDSTAENSGPVTSATLRELVQRHNRRV
jgi:CRISPR-associated protein (TIGR03986 family)